MDEQAAQAAQQAVEAKLPDGTTVRVRVAEGAEQADGLSSVKRRGEPLDLNDALAPIGEVAALVRERLESLTATRASVEFGVSFAVESGKLTALLFEGKASASLTVTLEWERKLNAGTAQPTGS